MLTIDLFIQTRTDSHAAEVNRAAINFIGAHLAP